MSMLETPSRILRRIEALEAQDSDLPSLPSFPEFEDSGLAPSFQDSSAHSHMSQKDLGIEHGQDDVPYESTPAPLSSQTTRSTVRPPSTSSSATRFANSMRTSLSTVRRSQQDSFEVSEILPTQVGDDSSTSASIPAAYLLPNGDDTEDRRPTEDVPATTLNPEDDIRSPRTFVTDDQKHAPIKQYDYSASLRSELKPSPLTLGRNVTLRKPVTRTRTPSLSRTTPSPTSISSNSTPRSTYSNLARGISPDPPSEVEPLHVEALPNLTDAEIYEDHVDMQENHHGADHEVDGEGDMGDQSQGEEGLPEPTFSSEEQVQSSLESGRARTPFPNAFSSPMQPRNTTPIASHTPRVYNENMDATATPVPGNSGVPEDLATPYNRRRSFLLSLVHSTTRPRITFPTPHPHARVAPTPRPRAHPLSQAWTPSPAHLDPSPRSNPSSGSSNSPHDRLSFISTASSHDLTVHTRANASFDPTTGAKGVGRFDAVKLNTYLHGLNRRLQQENEMLVSRLKMHGEEVEMDKVEDELERDGFHGVEEAVLQEVAAMHDELEKCELEKRAIGAETDALVESLQKEMDEVICERDTEREERKKDKERWKDRMAEVERGVEGVIKELERRLEEAERDSKNTLSTEEKVRELEAKCLAAEDDLNVAKCRAEKAESALASSSDLGAEVRQAYEHAAAYEEEVRIVKEHADQLERRLRDAELKEKQIRASSDDQLAELDAELRQSLETQQSAEAHALELDEELKEANNRLEELQDELRTTQQQTSQLMTETMDVRDRSEKQTVEIARAAEVARQMEDALEESERKMIADEEELASLRTKAARLERELETLRLHSHSIASSDQNDSLTRERTPHELDTDQLEVELDEAHREIGRLNHLLSGSPTRKAIDQAKDMRIELLEKEKDQLIERVRALASSPARGVYRSEQSPVPRRQVLVSRTPRTPGPLLKDYSWLHDNTILPKASPLVAQIEQLQQELHLANDSIDEKVNMLEEAGMGIVGLTEKFEDARTQVTVLEREVVRLMRREERRVQRLGRARCLKCGGRVDLSKLISISNEEQSSEVSSTSAMLDPKSPPSKTAESLRLAQLETDDVRAQLEKAKRDNRELEAELRATESVDQRARLLEFKVLKNQDVIENLRNERDSLAADQATLQRRYVDASAQVNRLRQELSTSQSSHEERCHQLDLRVNEIADLRRELFEQARELERLESERNDAKADRSGIVRSVASLELDLKRVRADAEALGRDLRDLRSERDRSETRHRDELGKGDRAQKQLCAQLRLANEQLEAQREKTRKAIAETDNHVCESNEQDIDELHTQHKNECKGLMVQIQYLKAKFTRESVFRADLTYQKHYLLDVLSTFENSEKQILAAVARIGFPVSTNQPVRKRHTLRTIAAAVLFIAKAKRASETWREQNVTKTAVQAALREVRRRRVVGP